MEGFLRDAGQLYFFALLAVKQESSETMARPGLMGGAVSACGKQSLDTLSQACCLMSRSYSS
jgi:hypothetical protein